VDYDSLLHRAVRKYGWEAFSINIIYSSYDQEHTHNFIEPLLIEDYNTLAPNGYNVLRGGKGRLRTSLTEQHKQRISQALKGKPKSLTAVENNRLAQKGKKRSRDSVKKQVESRKRNGVRSHQWTQEERFCLSEKLKKRPKYNQKRVQTPLGIFNSCSEAASAYNKTASWVTRMIIKGEFILLVG
jgi:group I intron endonuclease